MKSNIIFLVILLYINVSSAISFGVNASNYGGPSLGLNMTVSNITTDLDFIFSIKNEEVNAYNYYYTTLLKFDSKMIHLGIRVNPNYSLQVKICAIQFGPLFGYDRYWFKSIGKLPSASNTITAYDSTIIFNQYRAGLYFGAKFTLLRWLSVIAGTSVGYLFGENVNNSYMIKNKLYKFDILDNKIGLNFSF
jgi:hypothetical protein